jgi:hypothetical protein
MNQQTDNSKKGDDEPQTAKDSGTASRLLQPHLLTGHHTRGYLPHLKVEGGTYWVTLRLYDSLPQRVLSDLRVYDQQSGERGSVR